MTLTASRIKVIQPNVSTAVEQAILYSTCYSAALIWQIHQPSQAYCIIFIYSTSNVVPRYCSVINKEYIQGSKVDDILF